MAINNKGENINKWIDVYGNEL